MSERARLEMIDGRIVSVDLFRHVMDYCSRKRPMPRTDTERLDAIEKEHLSVHCYDHGLCDVIDPHGRGRVGSGLTLRAAIDAYLDAETQK